MEAACNLDVLVVARDQAAAFARIQVFGGLEAETTHLAEGAQFLVPPFAEVRLAGILDDREFVLARNGQDRIEIGSRPADVYRQDGSRAGRDGRLDLPRIHLKGLRIRVHKDRQRVLQQNGIDGRHERVDRHDHFVAGSDVQDVQRDEQRTGAVSSGKAMFGAQPVRPK